MMNQPPLENLIKKAGNKYILCNLVAKRAKQIQKRNSNEEIVPAEKEITEASHEVLDNKIVPEFEE